MDTFEVIMLASVGFMLPFVVATFVCIFLLLLRGKEGMPKKHDEAIDDILDKFIYQGYSEKQAEEALSLYLKTNSSVVVRCMIVCLTA